MINIALLLTTVLSENDIKAYVKYDWLQIVRHDRTMEQIVFPVPNICEYLTEESKVRVFTTTERDDQGSKVNDFFQQFDDLYNEMRWQKKIRSGLFHFRQKKTLI